MGLAEPKKRSKISHDPRNLSWSNQGVSSYGQRLMVAQGWQEGQSLGARTFGSSTNTSLRSHADDVSRLAAARVGVLFKDDNLGIGAKANARDVAEAQRTGLDAFQGLLGRLNGKVTDQELQEKEKKNEDRKLAIYAAGRWGGMIFVPGGVLVQGEEFKNSREAKKAVEEQDTEHSASAEVIPKMVETEDTTQGRSDKAERKRLRAERRLRKEDRRLRKLKKQDSKKLQDTDNSGVPEKALDKEATRNTETVVSTKKTTTAPPDEPISADEKDTRSVLPQPLNGLRQESRSGTSTPTGSGASTPLRNGRHLLRGRNIQAKRMAFADMKGLGEIFMREG